MGIDRRLGDLARSLTNRVIDWNRCYQIAKFIRVADDILAIHPCGTVTVVALADPLRHRRWVHPEITGDLLDRHTFCTPLDRPYDAVTKFLWIRPCHGYASRLLWTIELPPKQPLGARYGRSLHRCALDVRCDNLV